MTPPTESPMTADKDFLPFSVLLRDFADLRAFALRFVANLGAEQAMAVPAGFRNSLHWHVGHLLYTQSTALFEWCGLPSPLHRDFPEYFGRGTDPGAYDSLVPDWDELLETAQRQSRALPEAAGRLDAPLLKPIKLMNISMATVGGTLPFLLAHEGEHIAHIKRLRAAVLGR